MRFFRNNPNENRLHEYNVVCADWTGKLLFKLEPSPLKIGKKKQQQIHEIVLTVRN